jgi:hypothetical protein
LEVLTFIEAPIAENGIDDGIIRQFYPLPLNALSSIRANRDIDSNVIETCDLHSQKQGGLRTSADDGMAVQFNPLLQNALTSIRTNRDTSSNGTDLSELHQESRTPNPIHF